MKKSFATAFFAAMVVFVLIFLESVLFVQSTGVENANLHSRLAFERFEDARDLINWTQEDAIFDAAYAFACDSQQFCGAYTARVSSYWNNVAGELNDSIANASYSNPPVVSCGWIQVSPSTHSFSAGFGGILSVYANHSFKTASFDFAKTGGVELRAAPSGATVRVAETGNAFSYDCPGVVVPALVRRQGAED